MTKVIEWASLILAIIILGPPFIWLLYVFAFGWLGIVQDLTRLVLR